MAGFFSIDSSLSPPFSASMSLKDALSEPLSFSEPSSSSGDVELVVALSIDVDLAYDPNAVPLLGIEPMNPEDDDLGGVPVPRNGEVLVAKVEKPDENGFAGGDDGGCDAEGWGLGDWESGFVKAAKGDTLANPANPT